MQLLQIIEKHGRQPEDLISILLDYQACKTDNYISEDDVKMLARQLNLTESRIYSVLTFYTLLSTKPCGKYVVQVCNDVPCYVKGSVNVLKILEKTLGIQEGETTADGVFTLEFTSCLGCCDKAPAMRIGGQLYGNRDEGKIGEIIAKYRGQ